MRTDRLTLTLLFALLLGIAAGRPARGEGSESPELDPERAARGRVTYRTYCHNCHGEGGMGQGELAPILKVAPTDLTRLAAGSGGEFPFDRVVEMIDGRAALRVHGGREMPIWGDVFHATNGDPEHVARVEGRILDLVHYLLSLQEVEDEG